MLFCMTDLRLGGGLWSGERRLSGRAFTTFTGATCPANHLLGHAVEQEVVQP
jgi:hypothetical protein